MSKELGNQDGPEAAAAREALISFFELRSYDELSAWLSTHGPKRRSALLRFLLRKRSEGNGGLGYSPWIDLLVDLEADPKAAWERREAEQRRVFEFAEELDTNLEAYIDALDREEIDEAIEVLDALIARARELRAAAQVGFLQKLRGGTLTHRRGKERAEAMEVAIAALNESLAYAPVGAPALETMLDLARVYYEREFGDPVENLAIYSDMLAAALGLVREEDPIELRGLLSAEYAKSLMRREDRERRQNLEEGVESARAALVDLEAAETRETWIRAKLTLGGLLVNLANLEGEPTASGEQVFAEIIEWCGENHVPEIAAAAHHELARTKRIATRRSPMRTVEIIEAGNEAEEDERDLALRREAREHLRSAELLLGEHPGAIEIAQIRGELCLLHSQLGEDEAAIEAGRRALETLSPTRLPRLCHEVGFAVAAAYAGRGDWEDAASAYRAAIAASELVFQGLRDDARRTAETQGRGEVGRWAALAFSAVEEDEEALAVLENARTRELRRRLEPGTADAARLSEVPRGLREEYQAALSDLAASPLGDTQGAGQRLQDALAAIRKVPGLSGFGVGEGPADVLAAVEPGWPLLYVNPTPVGTLLLLAANEPDDGLAVSSRYLEEPTSTLAYMRLLAGADYSEEEEAAESASPSYLFAITGNPTAAQLHEAVGDTLGWVGSALARPIAEFLSEQGAAGVTLISCGPLATVPLATAPWDDGEGPRCLLDLFEVRYAPSAALTRTALERSRRLDGEEARLVGLADPHRHVPGGELPGTEPELREVARVVGGQAELAVGKQADTRFLRTSAGEATHVHLACHAGGGVFDLESMVVCLADGDLRAMELSGALRSRLVTVSACQSAVPLIGGPSGEVFAISTAFLAAGSACVVASLWEVNDLATAILMTRFYEEMFEAELRPPEALRRAQLWLRNLTDFETLDYLEGHPLLNAELTRRSRGGEHLGAGGSEANSWLTPGRPFSDPVFWAPFIAIGA
jgi:CHAT domain-containing protein